MFAPPGLRDKLAETHVYPTHFCYSGYAADRQYVHQFVCNHQKLPKQMVSSVNLSHRSWKLFVGAAG